MTESDLARRGFVSGSIATGFTTAVARAASAPIHTDEAGLVAGEVKIPVSDGAVPAYAARPAGAGPHPTLLVIEEIFGVHEWIQDVCRRFAKLGYAAVAPELYARIGDPAQYSDTREIVQKIILRAPDDRKMADLDAALAWAAANGGDPARVGVTGFCRGGRDTWLYAAHNPRLRAAVAWYGPVTGHVSPIQPKTPLDIAGEIHCPLLGLYGAKDAGIPQADLDAAAAKARAAGKIVDIEVFPDAAHGFLADYRDSYAPEAAKEGWADALAWLHRYLGS